MCDDCGLPITGPIFSRGWSSRCRDCVLRAAYEDELTRFGFALEGLDGFHEHMRSVPVSSHPCAICGRDVAGADPETTCSFACTERQEQQREEQREAQMRARVPRPQVCADCSKTIRGRVYVVDQTYETPRALCRQCRIVASERELPPLPEWAHVFGDLRQRLSTDVTERVGDCDECSRSVSFESTWSLRWRTLQSLPRLCLACQQQQQQEQRERRRKPRAATVCMVCGIALPEDARADQRYCGDGCRQRGHRQRKGVGDPT